MGVNGAKADECSDCTDAYGESWCVDNGFCQSSGGSTLDMSDMTMDGAYNTDCSDYANTYADSGYCQCYDGYSRNSDGSCSYGSSTINTDQSQTTTCSNGYAKARDGQCYAINADGSMENITNDDGNTGSCDASESCWFYNCCSSTTNTSSVEEDAAAQKAFNEANSKASALATQQNAAARNVDTAYANQQTACSSGNQAACTKATTALNDAKSSYDSATAAAQDAIQSANELAGITGNGNSSTGAGFMLCANGVIGTVCEGDTGSYITTGYSVGIGGTTGNGLPYSVVGAATTQKCGANFTDIGGVCFPTNTGLSSAPIYVILSNIFSWLMALFTTFAVIAFVISGIQYFMASGDESLAESAKTNATNAILGIIVGLSGFIIIRAIATALSGQGYFF